MNCGSIGGGSSLGDHDEPVGTTVDDCALRVIANALWCHALSFAPSSSSRHGRVARQRSITGAVRERRTTTRPDITRGPRRTPRARVCACSRARHAARSLEPARKSTIGLGPTITLRVSSAFPHRQTQHAGTRGQASAAQPAMRGQKNCQRTRHRHSREHTYRTRTPTRIHTHKTMHSN